MKRVVRSVSEREIYGPKWRSTESSEENENGGGDALHSAQLPSGAAQPNEETNVVDTQGETPPSEGAEMLLEGKENGDSDALHSAQLLSGATQPTEETIVLNIEGETQSSEGICRRGSISDSHESMYIAALEGDCVAAEMLLERDPKLASDEISEEGDRALHVAAAMNHQELVQKLVERMSPSDLLLLDGQGYTACCYAAISGVVEIANLMMKKNPTLASARDQKNVTPLYKAAKRKNAKMVSYLLKSTKVEDLSMEEWFDLLVMCILHEMYVVALEICGIDEQLATMRKDEGTALHLLARKHFFKNRIQWKTGVMRRDYRMLANKLLEGIQRLGKDSVIEIMKNPPILHYAAEVGNVELITMLTHTYPSLVWHTDSNGYTIFHIAVIHRKEILFGLINEIGARKDLIAAWQDENGDNILHLAAKLGPRDVWYTVIPGFRFREEVLWFKEVAKIVQPLCRVMRNKDGYTPYELFRKEHKSFAEKITTWTMNTADSLMLISTLILSVVFAAAFAVPGGYDQETGIPILFKSNWFTCFVISELIALFFSALSVLYFSRTMMGSDSKRISHKIRNGLVLLSLSVFGALSVFMSAYFLIYAKERAALVTAVIVIVYSALVFIVFIQTISFNSGISRSLFPRGNPHSLFKRHAYTAGWREQMTRKVFDFLEIF